MFGKFARLCFLRGALVVGLLLAPAAVVAAQTVVHKDSGAAAAVMPDAEFMERVDILTDWIVARTDYDKPDRPPAFLFLSADELNYTYFHQRKEGYTGQDTVHAVYWGGTVLLRDDFKLGRDDTTLVHELVHHLQFKSKARFDCVAASEREAYEIEIAFIEETGRGVPPDPLWVKLMRCAPGR